MIGAAYMHPATARALLAESQARTAKARAEREQRARLLREFTACGWDHKAAAELAAIHINLQGIRQ